jgi:hypothetical protein
MNELDDELEALEPMFDAVEDEVADDTEEADLVVCYPLMMNLAAVRALRNVAYAPAGDKLAVEHLRKHAKFLVDEMERYIWCLAQE